MLNQRDGGHGEHWYEKFLEVLKGMRKVPQYVKKHGAQIKGIMNWPKKSNSHVFVQMHIEEWIEMYATDKIDKDECQ